MKSSRLVTLGPHNMTAPSQVGWVLVQKLARVWGVESMVYGGEGILLDSLACGVLRCNRRIEAYPTRPNLTNRVMPKVLEEALCLLIPPRSSCVQPLHPRATAAVYGGDLFLRILVASGCGKREE